MVACDSIIPAPEMYCALMIFDGFGYNLMAVVKLSSESHFGGTHQAA